MGTPPLPFHVQLELTRAWWLLGLAVLPAVVYFFYRSLVDFPRWQRVLSLWLRAAILVLLVLALAGLNLVRPTRELFVVFAVDRSESVGEQGSQAIDAFLKQAAPLAGTNHFAVLPFAAEPGTIRNGVDAVNEIKTSATAESDSKKVPTAASEPGPADAKGLDRKGTDLAAALEVAAAAIPPFYVPRIVLLSDGNATTGDSLKTAAALRGKVEVLTVTLPVRTDPEVQLSAVTRPASSPARRAV